MPSGPWDDFSVRNIGLRVNRRMAREFGGDSEGIVRASVADVGRALGVSSARWNQDEQRAFENWALVLALIPDMGQWSADEKWAMVRIIRAQAGVDEMRYLRLTQRHARLRAGLLRLGLKA